MHSARKFFFAETGRVWIVEQKAFTGDTESDLLEAGIEMFARYGDVNSLESLSNGDVTKWPAIKAMNRGEVFVKLLIDRDKNKFQKALHEIRTRPKTS